MADKNASATWVINLFVVRNLVSATLSFNRLRLRRVTNKTKLNKKKPGSNSMPSSKECEKLKRSSFFFPHLLSSRKTVHTQREPDIKLIRRNMCHWVPSIMHRGFEKGGTRRTDCAVPGSSSLHTRRRRHAPLSKRAKSLCQHFSNSRFQAVN